MRQDVEATLKMMDDEVGQNAEAGEEGEGGDAKNLMLKVGKLHCTRNPNMFVGSVGTFSDLHIAKLATRGRNVVVESARNVVPFESVLDFVIKQHVDSIVGHREGKRRGHDTIVCACVCALNPTSN